MDDFEEDEDLLLGIGEEEIEIDSLGSKRRYSSEGEEEKRGGEDHNNDDNDNGNIVFTLSERIIESRRKRAKISSSTPTTSLGFDDNIVLEDELENDNSENENPTKTANVHPTTKPSLGIVAFPSSKSSKTSLNQPTSHPKEQMRMKNEKPETEKLSGLRLIGWRIPPSSVSEYTDLRAFLNLSQVQRHLSPDQKEIVLRGEETEEWVTIGVVSEISLPKTTSNGNHFTIWKLSDLQGIYLSLFLFGEAYSSHFHENEGVVVAVISPKILPAKEKGGSFSLSVSSLMQIVPLGVSADFAICKAPKKDGTPCKMQINKLHGEYCEYHLTTMYKKIRSKRPELNTTIGGQKTAGISNIPKERNLSQGSYQIGNSVINRFESIQTPLSKTTQPIKSNNLSNHNNTNTNILLQKALVKGGAGARNLMRINNPTNSTNSTNHGVVIKEAMKVVDALTKVGGNTVKFLHPNSSLLHPSLPTITPSNPTVQTLFTNNTNTNTKPTQSNAKIVNSAKTNSNNTQPQTNINNNHAKTSNTINTQPQFNVGINNITQKPIPQSVTLPQKSTSSLSTHSSTPTKSPTQLNTTPLSHKKDFTKKTSPNPSAAILRAIEIVKAKGGLSPVDPNKVTFDMNQIGEVFSRGEEGSTINKSNSANENVGGVKQEKKQSAFSKMFDEAFGPLDLNSEEGKKLLKQESINAHLPSRQEEAFDALCNHLAEKETMVQKMDAIFEIQVAIAFYCSICDRTSEKRGELCTAEKHQLQILKNVRKRFFKCKGCQKRVAAVHSKYPLRACSKCNSTQFKQVSMAAYNNFLKDNGGGFSTLPNVENSTEFKPVLNHTRGGTAVVESVHDNEDVKWDFD